MAAKAKTIKMVIRKKRVEPLPTTWRKRLTRALVDPAYAAKQRDKWFQEANHWTSCAVGERWALLGLPGKAGGLGGHVSPSEFGDEHDYTDDLGMKFMVHVRDSEFADALVQLNLMDNLIITNRKWRTK